MVGRSLSHFRIVAKIGAGGMGTVYRAEDEKLRRTVALKVLSPDSTGVEGRRRLLREARTAAAISHPNVASVFDVGEVDGIAFIVMEYVEGATLRSRLDEGRLPTAEALAIAHQIAKGLAAAHEARVVHRDLKPENVVLARDGQVKILDFGLARPLGKAVMGEAGDGRDAPTVSVNLTAEGAILGTVSYMSPEQVQGRRVNTCSDLFSFGVVLHEMLTGELPFRDQTAVETLAAIMRKSPDPPLDRNPRIPAGVRPILGRLLAKDPQDRYDTTTELVRYLQVEVEAPASGRSGTILRRKKQPSLCVCGRSETLPFCDGSHAGENWSCTGGAKWERFGFCASSRYGNLAAKLASHFQGAFLPEGESSAAVGTLVTIVDGTDLDYAIAANQQTESEERVVVTFGVAAGLVRDLFPRSRFLDLGDLKPIQSFRRIASFLEEEGSAEDSSVSPTKLHSAFISHGVDDEKLLTPVIDYLSRFFHADLFTCGESIAPGENWHATILEALRSKDRFICMLSSASLDSHFCSFEIGMAAALCKPTNLISLDGSRPPAFVQHIQCVDLERVRRQKPWLERADLVLEELIRALS